MQVPFLPLELTWIGRIVHTDPCCRGKVAVHRHVLGCLIVRILKITFSNMWTIYENSNLFMLKTNLKVPSGQIGCAWECYHLIGLEKDINRNRFFIFYFWSWWEFKVLSHFMQKLFQPPACLDHRLHMLKQRPFPPNHAPKMQERHQCSLDYGSWVKNSNIPQSKPK